MNICILYDSQYGNTGKIAELVTKSFAKRDTVFSIPASNVKLTDIRNIDLLIVGSPTHGGRPTQSLSQFLDSIPNGYLKSVKFAAFDTRFSPQNHGIGLRILMKLIGFAAPKIAHTLIAKGGTQIAPPEGFIVDGKQGPLGRGELERALHWSKTLIQNT